MQWQGRSRRKFTGKMYRYSRKKRKYELGREPSDTIVGVERKKIVRVRGGNIKVKALKTNAANIFIPDEGVVKRAVIESVTSNPANVHYARRNIITKGALVKTDLGIAKVTSRPGQHGIVNGILIEKA